MAAGCTEAALAVHAYAAGSQTGAVTRQGRMAAPRQIRMQTPGAAALRSIAGESDPYDGIVATATATASGWPAGTAGTDYQSAIARSCHAHSAARADTAREPDPVRQWADDED